MVKDKDESAKADKANKKGVKDSRAKDIKPAQEKTPKKVADKKNLQKSQRVKQILRMQVRPRRRKRLQPLAQHH
jgi:hypothetical protein